MAHWHGLAKLRMHHDLTLDIMESVTACLGKLLRLFADVTCPAFKTRELRREADARARRQLKKAIANQGGSDISQLPMQFRPEVSPAKPISAQHQSSIQQHSPAGARRLKTFNLNTYKGHSYGDYVKTIREYGTTDSFSTEPVR
jgi:hypothetical protein